MRSLLVVAALLVAGLAHAGDDNSGAKGGGDGSVRNTKTTTIDFEGDTIEGDLTRPDGEYIEARKQVKHSNLIRIREDFKDQVMESVGQL